MSLCRSQLRHINHAFINIATSILGGWRCNGIWRIRWNPIRYWRILRLMRCVMWRSGWLLTERGNLRCINDWIIKCTRHRYHRWWQIIAIWVTVLAIKAPVITRSVLRRSGWLLMNWGQLRSIDDWIIQRRRHIYHRWWQLVALWVTILAIKSPVITSSCSLPTPIVPCSTFVETTNTLWTWHGECNMSLWWFCVPVILCVDGYQKLRDNFLAWQLQSCLSFSTRNKIDYDIFVSI